MSTSVGSTSTRLSGLVSGMDTDALVKAALATDTAKIEKYKANLQIDEWKTDAYREVTSIIQSFYNTYFNPTSASNLKSVNNFASFATSYSETNSSNYVSLAALSGATTGTYTVSSATLATSAQLTGSGVSAAIKSTAAVTDFASLKDTTLSISLNGTTKSITIGSCTDLNGLVNDLNSKIDAAFGADKLTFASSGGGISITADRATDSFSVASTGTANSLLNLNSSNLSNKIDLSATISSLANSLSTTVTTGTDNTVAFTINGQSFSFDTTKSTLQNVMDTVNANATANVTMKYNTTSNSFSITSNTTGLTTELAVADTADGGNLMTALGIAGTDTGTDSSITISDGTSTKTIVRSSNSFVYENISYNIKQTFTTDTDPNTSNPNPIVATVSTDTSKTYDYIKGFVDKYNEIIENINGKLSEERYKAYKPLTDEQKEAMTEDQIKKWETKAKSGMLKNDSIVSGMITKLRTALSNTVESAGITLSSIGITPSSIYSENGKLEINETKLKTALANKSEQITKLFTSNSDKSYYEAINDADIRTERYNESGIAQRFSDIIQDAIRTTTDSKGNKGSLLEKAGIKGDRSQYTNVLYKEMQGFQDTIDSLNDRLSDKEKALYAKYTAMESAMSKLNSQQSYITSMLGSSS